MINTTGHCKSCKKLSHIYDLYDDGNCGRFACLVERGVQRIKDWFVDMYDLINKKIGW